MRRRALAALIGLASLAGAGCGLQVQSPDLFMLTRSGAGGRFSVLVNDAGTIRCNGGAPHTLAGPLLLSARDLATSLSSDAQAALRIPSPGASVYRYTIRLQDGTIAFPDTAAARHSELAQAELFALQAAHGPCKLTRG